jgi:hypothetical protein
MFAPIQDRSAIVRPSGRLPRIVPIRDAWPGDCAAKTERFENGNATPSAGLKTQAVTTPLQNLCLGERYEAATLNSDADWLNELHSFETIRFISQYLA